MYIPLTNARADSCSISWAELYLSLIFTKCKKEILDKILAVGEISRKKKKKLAIFLHSSFYVRYIQYKKVNMQM